MHPTSTRPIAVFDLDGTLADSILDLVPALNRTIAKYDLRAISMDEIGHVAGNGAKPMIELAYKLNNRAVSTSELEELFEIFIEDYWDSLSTNTKMYPGVKTCLQRFVDEDWIVAVCSNKPVEFAKKLLTELELIEVFSIITGGDSYSYRKPDPRHLLDTIANAGGSSAKAIMVGDTKTDILAAQNAKIPVIAVDFGYCDQHVSHYDPDRIISHYDELFETATTLIAAVK